MLMGAIEVVAALTVAAWSGAQLALVLLYGLTTAITALYVTKTPGGGRYSQTAAVWAGASLILASAYVVVYHDRRISRQRAAAFLAK